MIFQRYTYTLLAASCALIFTIQPEVAAAAPSAAIPQDASSAVVFVYHGIGDEALGASNLEREQFEEQIKELQSGEYNVLPLPAVVTAIKAGDKLPDRAIALTFDGAHRSTIEWAAPLLIKENMPFTIFVAPDMADLASQEVLSWDQIRKYEKTGLVTIGIHTSNYSHILNKTEEEITRQVNNARVRFRREMGSDPAFFAYPFGEISTTFRNVIEKQGFSAAFGQQSGVVYTGADMLALPRFSMTGSYGTIDRFRLTAHALPLPVSDIVPRDFFVATNQPAIGFTVDPSLTDTLDKLSCFATESGMTDVQKLGNNRVEIRLAEGFGDSRGRVNCTIPGPTDLGASEPRWRWFGLLLTVNATTMETGTAPNIESAAGETSYQSAE